MLYDSERHMQITTEKWNSNKAVEGAHQIFEFLCTGVDESGFWPAHPDEEGDLPYNKSIYNGAAGTLWALRELATLLKQNLSFDSQQMVDNIHANSGYRKS